MAFHSEPDLRGQVYKLVRFLGPMSSGDVYKRFPDVTTKTVHNHLLWLARHDYIDGRRINGGTYGRTTLWGPRGTIRSISKPTDRSRPPPPRGGRLCVDCGVRIVGRTVCTDCVKKHAKDVRSLSPTRR